MRRFFYNQINVLKIGENVPLTDEIFHHWCKVLRANVGEQAIFFDGQGGEYTVTLTEINKKSALANIESYDPINRDLPYQVHIGLVMSRGERMDYAIQKATEMGVTSIQLLISERCEVRLKNDQIDKKLEHWQGVAIAACEQCGLNFIPSVVAPQSIEDWSLQKVSNTDNLDVQQNWNNNVSKTISTGLSLENLNTKTNLIKLVLAVPTGKPITSAWQKINESFSSDLLPCFILLIGAEGGLTEDEIENAQQQGFLAWQIGDRVLRTETAPIAALAALQTLHSTVNSHLSS